MSRKDGQEDCCYATRPCGLAGPCCGSGMAGAHVVGWLQILQGGKTTPAPRMNSAPQQRVKYLPTQGEWSPVFNTAGGGLFSEWATLIIGYCGDMSGKTWELPEFTAQEGCSAEGYTHRRQRSFPRRKGTLRPRDSTPKKYRNAPPPAGLWITYLMAIPTGTVRTRCAEVGSWDPCMPPMHAGRLRTFVSARLRTWRVDC
jgi:hypothetical protein